MHKTRISPGIVAFLLLFLLSIIIRFNSLHLPLLDDQEAAIALKAASGSSGFLAGFSGEAGFSSMLSVIFAVFGKNETTARILSAIFGMAIVAIPFLFRKVLGKETSFILSVLLMFDPGLIAYSRQVNGAVISVCGLLFAFGFLFNKRYILAGIAGGLALLGSPILWPGLLALGLALWLSGFEKEKIPDNFGGGDLPETSIPQSSRMNGIIALAATILVVGTVFFSRPEGLTAPLTNLTAYFKGWTVSNGFPFLLLLFSFILYQPIALLFGLIEGFYQRRNGDRVAAFLLRWFFLSLLLAVVYPSKGMDAIILSFIPLLTLFAKFIFRTWQSLEKPDLAALGQMVLVILLIPFAWMNAIVLRFPIEGQDETLRLAAVAGALVLLIMSSVLIRFGWPPKQSESGLFLGFAVLICIFTFSTAWRSAGLGKYPQAELWRYDGITDEADLLVKTAGDMSEWNKVSRQGIDITVVNYPSPSLIWALRDFTNVKEDHYLPVSSNPSIVITAAEAVPALAEAYRGQDIVLNRKTAWSLILPEEWIQWYAFREVPQEKQQLIIWARTDLFPGAANQFPTAINQPQ
jgi:hypothetical protein